MCREDCKYRVEWSSSVSDIVRHSKRTVIYKLIKDRWRKSLSFHYLSSDAITEPLSSFLVTMRVTFKRSFPTDQLKSFPCELQFHPPRPLPFQLVLHLLVSQYLEWSELCTSFLLHFIATFILSPVKLMSIATHLACIFYLDRDRSRLLLRHHTKFGMISRMVILLSSKTPTDN